MLVSVLSILTGIASTSLHADAVAGAIGKQHGMESTEWNRLDTAKSNCAGVPHHKPETRKKVQLKSSDTHRAGNYVVYYPKGYNTSFHWPIVFGFHGFNSDVDKYRDESGLEIAANKHGFVLVLVEAHNYPLASRGWSFPGCNASPRIGETDCKKRRATCTHNTPDGQACSSRTCPSNTCQAQSGCHGQSSSCLCNMTAGLNCNWCGCLNDVAFVQEVLATVDSHVCIDHQRRFAQGHSMGGMFVNYLMSKLSNSFAAFVIFAGLNPRDFYFPPSTNSKAATMFVHGMQDPSVPHDGKADDDGNGYWYETVWDDVNRISSVYGCAKRESNWNIATDANVPASAEIHCKRHTGCDHNPQNIDRLGYCLFKGPHKFPKGWGTDLMWLFMNQHSKN